MSLVVPGERVQKLISKLKGKAPHRLSYVYSDKAKALWDAALLGVCLGGIAYFLNCARVVEASTNPLSLKWSGGVYRALAVLLGFPSAGLFFKALTDFKYWSKSIADIIRYVRRND